MPWSDTQYESALATLHDEWRGVQAAETRRVEAETAVTLTAWISRLSEMVREQHSLQQSGVWIAGAADLLSIVGRARRETFHCAILAWLFDPLAPHGLGDALLRWLFEQVLGEPGLSDDDLRSASTGCEYVRPRSRADIVIVAPHHTVVFEAKIDADERPRQCDDLFEDWSREADPRFVFLTPRGRAPVTASGAASEEFVCLSFRTIKETLRELRACGAPEAIGRSALDTYLRTLEVEFP